MELAGLQITLDADITKVKEAYDRVMSYTKDLQSDIQKSFNSIPDLGKKLKFTSEGAGEAVKQSKELQQQRKLEIAGTKELLAVQKEASDRIIKAYNNQHQAQVDNIKQTKSLQASINAINKQREEEAKKVSAAIIKSYNDEHQAQVDNIKTIRNLQAAVDKINRQKLQDAKALEAAQGKQLDLYGQLVKESNDSVRAYYNASAAVIKYGDAAGISAKKLEELRTSARNGQEQLKQIEAGAGRYQRFVGSYSTALEPFKFSIAQITREMPAFANSLQTGFMGISNNIASAVDAFRAFMAEQKELQAQGKPSKTALQGITAALFSWNTALSIGITALTVYGPEITKWLGNLSSAKDKLKEARDEQIKFANATAEATSEQVIKYNLLRSSIDRINQGMVESKNVTNEQNRVVNLYNETIGASTDKVKTYSEAVAGFNAYGQKYINTVLSMAKANVVFEEMKTAYADLRKAQIQADNTTFRDYLNWADKMDVILKDGKLVLKDRVVEKGEFLRDQPVVKAVQRLGRLYEEYKGLVDEANTTGLDVKIEGDAKKKEKNIKTLADITKELNKELSLAESRRTLGTFEGNELEKQIKYYEALQSARQKFEEGALKEIKNPLTIDNEIIQENAKALKDYAASIEAIENQKERSEWFVDFYGDLRKNIQEAKSLTDGQTESLQKQFEVVRKAQSELQNSGYSSGFVLPLLKALEQFLKGQAEVSKAQDEYKEFIKEMQTINLSEQGGFITGSEASTERLKLLNEQLKDLIKNGNWLEANEIRAKIVTEEGRQAIENLTTDLNNLISTTLPKLGEALGEGIGDAFVTGDFDAIFKPLGVALGQQIKELGKLLIQAGIVKEGIDEAIRNMTFPGGGYGLIIAGVAAVALGQVMQATLSKRVSSVGRNFADGGIVYGETFARVGEYSNSRGNPEIIAPLDRLQSLLGDVGGGRQVELLIPEVTLRGEDLRLSLERANRRFNR